ncbi:MAG: redoxin domain-containing protein [Calditrichota bacterium]
MKRKLAFLLATLGFGVMIFLGYKITTILVFQAAVRKHKTTLPNLDYLASLDGQKFQRENLPPEKAVILLYCQSDCGFCTGEIEDILDHPSLIADVSLLLVSSEKDSVLKTFQKKYDLKTYPYIQVLHSPSDDFYQTFGTNVFPSAFVYDRYRKLLKQYRGQVRANILYQTIESG